jgi:DNA-binding IclR family transcriptional regulator
MNTANLAVKSGTQVVQRVAALMRGVSARNRVGARLIDLCTEIDIERPTAHRILQGLVSEGLIRQDESTKRYFLGNAVYEMGLAASPRTNLRDLCRIQLQQLAQSTGDTAFLISRAGFDGVCIDRAEGTFPIKVFALDIGCRRPINIGGGAIAILSFLDDNEIERILKINKERCSQKYSNYSEADVRKKIAHTRKHGYVISDVLEISGVRSVAVPVFNKNNHPIAALSVATLSSRMDKERIELSLDCINKAIEQIQPNLSSIEAEN